MLESALKADYALIRGHKADTMGNLSFRGTSMNFNGVMVTAATVSIVEVDEIVSVGEIDSYRIDTPGLYVNRIVEV